MLALCSTGIVAASGSVSVTTRNAPPGSNRSHTARSLPDTRPDHGGAVNIEAHGARPGADTRALAKTNTDAIRNAARAAGDGGTVYVPEGEFFFGDVDDSFAFRFGLDDPRGISIVGAGPERSKLTITSSLDPTENYRGFTYEDEDRDSDYDHGAVTVEDVCIDGNYQNLDMNSGKTIWGFDIYGDGTFTFDNACIRGWWANAVRFSGPSVRINRCTFRENAIGVAQAATSNTAGHHLSARPAAGNPVRIEDSSFVRCSGSVITRNYGDGEITLRRTWISGFGHSVLKLGSTDGTTRVADTYVKANTDWLRRNLPAAFEMDGRWFLHRIAGKEHTPTVVLDEVVGRDFSREFILCFKDTDLVLKGDGIAIQNAATNVDRDVGIRGDEGIRFDVGTLSVSGTYGSIFDAPGSSGRIETLHRPSSSLLGATGTVSIGKEVFSGPIVPTVVSREDVGIETAAHDGSVRTG